MEILAQLPGNGGKVIKIQGVYAESEHKESHIESYNVTNGGNCRRNTVFEQRAHKLGNSDIEQNGGHGNKNIQTDSAY